MNPSKSLMALGALLLLAPAAAKADDWKEINTATQAYFVNPKDLPDFVRLQKGPFNGPVPLWVEQSTPQGPTKVESPAALGCVLHKAAAKNGKPTRTCHINVNSKAGGAYRVPVKIGEKQPPIPPAVRQASSQKPESVPQEVWDAVVNSKVPQAQWARAAGAAAKVLASKDGQAAAKLRGASKENYDKVLAQISQDITDGKNEDDIVKRAIDLSETLPVPKGLQTKAPPTAANNGGKGKGDGTGTPDAGGDNVLNTLATELAKKPVQADFAARLTAYLSKPTGQDAFIAPTAKPKAMSDADFKKQLQGQVTVFVTSATESADRRGRSAVLYYMIGEEGKPWLKDFPELEAMTRESDIRHIFDLKMKPFTVAGGKPYGGDAEWVPATLSKALDLAAEAWTDKRVKGKVRESVEQNDQGLVVPGSIGKGTDLKDLMARAFNMKDMYENGAVTATLQIPGSNPPKFRKLSIKVYSGTTDWGPPPVQRDQIGIFDISEPGDGRAPSNIFGQFFPLNQRGESTFPLDDRTGGQMKYKLTLNQGNLSFAMVDAKGKPTDSKMTTSIHDLYEARNKQVASDDQSYTASIGGQNFRVIPQGGPNGALLYFPVDKSGAMGDSPSMSVALTELGPDGRVRNLPGNRDLGYVGTDADGKPQFYYLAWNAERGVFEPHKGDKPSGPPWDAPPKPAPPKDKGGKGDGKGDGTGDGTGTGDDQTAPPNDGNDANPDQKDQAELPATELSSCKYKKYFGTDTNNQLYRNAKGWKLYTQAVGEKTDTNNTYLCVYNTLGLFFPGVIGSDDASMDVAGGADGVLHVLAVGAGAADDGHKYFMPSELPGVYVAGDNLAYKANGKEKVVRPIENATDWYIPLKGLQASLKASKGIANAAKVAWASKARDLGTSNPNPSVLVYLHPNDDALAVVDKAIATFAADGPCASGKGKMTEYLKAAIADPEFKTALDAFKVTDANNTPPSIDLKCRAQATSAGGDWNIAVPSWATSHILKAKDGKIDTSSGYWSK